MTDGRTTTEGGLRALLLASVLGGVLALSGAASWAAVFDVRMWGGLALASTLLGVVAGLFGWWTHRLRSAWWTVVLAVAVTAGVLWAGAWALARTQEGDAGPLLGFGRAALVDGWLTQLTVPLPVPFTNPFVQLSLVLVALTAALTSVAIASGRIGVALFTSVALWGAGLVMSAGASFPWALTTLPVVAAILLVLVASRGRRASVSAHRPGWQSMFSGIALAALALSISWVLATPLVQVTGRQEFDPRRYVDPPTSPTALTSPLDAMGALLADKQDAVVFRAEVTGNGGVAPSRFWQVASMDGFDGVSWEVAGRTVPTIPANSQAVSSVEQMAVSTNLELTSFVSPWVPRQGTATDLLTPQLVIQPDTGNVLSLASRTVDIGSDVPQPTAEDLLAASGVIPDGGQSLAVPPCLPAAWVKEVASVASGLPYAARADAVITWVRGMPRTEKGSRLVSAPQDALPGHSCDRLLLAYRGEQVQVSSEQLATIAVLALRIQGIPARLGFGYRVQAPEPDGTYAARTNDVAAFPEIWYDGVGWLPREVAVRESSAESVPLESDRVEKVQSAAGSGKTQQEDEPPVPLPEPVEPSPWWVLPLVAGISALLLLGLWVVGVEVWRRRRWRLAQRHGDVRAQVLGAWDEALRLEVAGSTATDDIDSGPVAGILGRTAADHAGRMGVAWPEAQEPAGDLAVLVDRAIYSDRAMARDHGRRAWNQVREVAGAASRHRTWRQRIRRAFDPTK